MTTPGFPDGAYFSVIGNVRLEAGGQTRLALLRHRLFTQHAGVSLPILTYNPVASYEPIRRELRMQGQLLARSVLRNLHEELRTWEGLGEGSGTLPDLGDHVDDVEAGYLWRRRFRVDTDRETWDYLRPDGTRYLRTPPTDVAGDVFLCGDDGETVQSWSDLGGLWRWWTSRVIPATGRVFLISDSRFIAQELGRLHDPRIHLLHQMHNPHVTGDRRWNSPVAASYAPAMERISDLDGLLSLTERQRDDIAKRYGATSNLFVVPNPVEAPAAPDPLPERKPRSIVMIARLDSQKRIDRAIQAFGRVHTKLPDTTLDVYGDGPLRADLEQQAADAGLAKAVTFHGHDPQAREALWSASLFWLTSQFEGYPLSTLEAMSHGVPVVSMDMPYGPREQITDGVDGALVPFADVSTMAERTFALLRDPRRVDAMRDAARAKAAEHGHDRFLADWASVLDQAVALKRARRSVSQAKWSITANEVSGSTLRFAGTLDVETPFESRLDELQVVAQAWSPDAAALVDLPVSVTRDGSTFSFSGEADLRRFVEGPSALARVGYVWAQNASFEHLTETPVRVKRRWF